MTDERFKNIEIKIGILLLTVVLSTLAALIYVGYKNQLFAKRIRYYVTSHTGEKLFKGMAVKFEGFRMGEVSRIELNDDGKIILTIKILNKYQKWIKSDSRVFFNQESMIGEPYLGFTVGSKDKPVMPEGSEFALEFEGGIDEIIKKAKPVMEDIRKIVENLRALSDYLSSPTGDLRSFLSSVRKTGRNIEAGRGAVPYLLNSSDSRARLESILDGFTEVEESYNNLALRLTSASSRMDTLIKNFDDTLVNKVNPIFDDISKTTGNLYLFRREGEYTLRLGSDLLLKLNNTWPFTPSVKEKKTPELPNP